MKIGIFGGTGFIGSYLALECVTAGHHPVLLVRKESRDKVPAPEHARTVYGTLSDETAIRDVLNGADTAIYSVGLIREFPRRGITFEELHVQAFRRVLRIAEEAGVRRVLLISANGADPDGTGYQRSKYNAEEYLRASPLEGVILRPSIVFGDPGEKFEFTTMVRDSIVFPSVPVPLFFKGIDVGSAGTFSLAPVHVKDVAKVAIRSLTSPEAGITYDLCGPDIFTWRELVGIIATAVERKKIMLPVPAIAIRLAASIFDRYSWFPISRDQLVMLLEGNLCKTSGVFEQFNIDPTPFNLHSLGYLTGKNKKGQNQ
ncbi:NAD(P)H-binding protein [Candidatus Latescibacterota bacterium]